MMLDFGFWILDFGFNVPGIETKSPEQKKQIKAFS
jgi:hypothetical protein